MGVMIMVLMATAASIMMIVMRMVMFVIMLMVMRMVVLVRVIMTVVIVMVAVIMPMIVAMRMRGEISAALGIKSGFNGARLAAKALNHGDDHMILPDTQLLSGDLDRQMPIAQLPCELQKMLGTFAGDFDEGFRCTHDLDKAAILQLDGIARAQSNGFRQIEKERKPANAFHRDTASVAIVKLQNYGISWFAFPRSAGQNIVSGDH
jgi:hypothetical protein